MTNDNKYDVRYVAIYLRKSRGEEEDLQKHELILVDICKKNNWKYIEFKEIGTSDSIDLRPEMQRLLSDVENELFDAVLVVGYDRLSRGDMGQQDKIKKKFKKSNTLIITPNKIYDLNNDTDEMYTDFAGFIATQEYKMIKKRLLQGKKVGSRMGNWTNGIPPFGYQYEKYKDKHNEKGLVVNDEELPIYNYIIKRALENESPHNIAWELNKQDIKTRQGKNWSNVAIYRILTNETYLGKIISNKQKGDGHKIKKNHSEVFKRLPKSEWIIVENCHEAIITQEDFDKIQLLIDKRRILPLASRAFKGEFTGILICAICGHTMQVQKKNDGNDVIKSCRHINENGIKCHNRGGLLKGVKEELNKAILEYRDRIIENIGKNDNTNLELIKKKLNVKYKELKKYGEALERVHDSYDLGDYSREEFMTRKNKWEEKIVLVEEEIIRLERDFKSQEQVTNHDKLSIISSYLENIDKISDVKDKNKFHKTLIDSVIWRRIGNEEPEVVINFL